MTDTLVYLAIFGIIGVVGALASAIVAWAMHGLFRTLNRHIITVISALPIPLALLMKAHSISTEYTARLRLNLTAWERDGDAIGYGVSLFICFVAAVGAFAGGLAGGWFLARRKLK